MFKLEEVNQPVEVCLHLSIYILQKSNFDGLWTLCFRSLPIRGSASFLQLFMYFPIFTTDVATYSSSIELHFQTLTSIALNNGEDLWRKDYMIKNYILMYIHTGTLILWLLDSEKCTFWGLILLFFKLVLGEWEGGDSIILLPKTSPVLNDNHIR